MLIGKRRRNQSSSAEPVRVLLVEDDPDTLDLVRDALDKYKRAKFVVEAVASSNELRDELARRAVRDELTGLYSRTFLIESLASELRRVWRNERDLSCLIVGLDDLKPINDSRGQDAGNAALLHVASLIRDSVRKEDLVARFTRDEFCVLLIETPLNAAITVAERIRFELAAQPVVLDGQSFSVTASIGVCAASGRDDHEPDTVLDRAAAALQEAKAAGKNRVSANRAPEESDQGEAEGFRPPDLGQQSDATLT
jgi:diguanylate cyclase (GGDEF)-like protein